MLESRLDVWSNLTVGTTDISYNEQRLRYVTPIMREDPDRLYRVRSTGTPQESTADPASEHAERNQSRMIGRSWCHHCWNLHIRSFLMIFIMAFYFPQTNFGCFSRLRKWNKYQGFTHENKTNFTSITNRRCSHDQHIISIIIFSLLPRMILAIMWQNLSFKYSNIWIKNIYNKKLSHFTFNFNLYMNKSWFNGFFICHGINWFQNSYLNLH